MAKRITVQIGDYLLRVKYLDRRYQTAYFLRIYLPLSGMNMGEIKFV